MFLCEGDYIFGEIMCCTEGGHLNDAIGAFACAVVTLSSDVQLTGSSETGWSF